MPDIAITEDRVVVARPGAPLAWTRLRATAAPHPSEWVLYRSLAQSLPRLPVEQQPLVRLLARKGARLETHCDAAGLTLTLTTTQTSPPAEDLVRAALRQPPPEEARDEWQSWWAWTRSDGEALADLVADLALHRPQRTWPDFVAQLQSDDPGRDLPTLLPPGRSLNSVLTLGRPLHIGHDRLPPGISPVAQPNPPKRAPTGAAAVTARFRVISEGSTLVRLAWAVPPRPHPDFPALSIAARIAGGHYRARLVEQFRGVQGWSYSPWALLRSGPEKALWQMSFRVPSDHSDEALSLAGNLVGVLSEPAGQAEVDTAIAHAVAEIERQVSSGSGLASLLGYWQDLGLAVDQERDSWIERLRAVTPHSTAAAAQRWLSQEAHLTALFQ